jgi:hypothetical protein
VAESGSHGRHDRFAIAEAVGTEFLTTDFLPMTLRSCPACGALHADLLSLQRAVREAWTPSRPRDLRLSVADALRLRRRGWRQRFALIGGPGDALTRPLALSFTALGLIGLLLTTIPVGLPMGSAGAAPRELDKTTVAAAPEPSAAASGPAVVSVPSASVAGDPGVAVASAQDARRIEEPSPLPLLSAVLLVLGAAILGLRRLASRTRAMR